MKKIFALFFFCFVLVLSACSSNPARLIVGKWQEVNGKSTIEFFQNGTVSVAGSTGWSKKPATATFKFVGDNHLKLGGSLKWILRYRFPRKNLL